MSLVADYLDSASDGDENIESTEPATKKVKGLPPPDFDEDADFKPAKEDVEEVRSTSLFIVIQSCFFSESLGPDKF